MAYPVACSACAPMMIWGTAMPCSEGFQPDAADAAPDA